MKIETKNDILGSIFGSFSEGARNNVLVNHSHIVENGEKHDLEEEFCDEKCIIIIEKYA